MRAGGGCLGAPLGGVEWPQVRAVDTSRRVSPVPQRLQLISVVAWCRC